MTAPVVDAPVVVRYPPPDLQIRRHDWTPPAPKETP